MNPNELRDLLPAERPLPAARRRTMKEQLMEQIGTDGQGNRRRYRLVVGAVAALILVITAVVLANVGGDESGSTDTSDQQDEPERTGRWTPDPDEVAVALERWREYGAGELPSIAAAEVKCVPPPGTIAEDDVVDVVVVGEDGELDDTLPYFNDPRWMAGDLGEPLTIADYVEACTSAEVREQHRGPEQNPDLFDPAQATACVIPGQHPEPWVTLGGLRCEDVTMPDRGTNHDDPDDMATLRPMTDDDVAMLDRMRAIEIAVLADDVTCRDRESAAERLQAILDEEALDLEVEVPTDEDFQNPPQGLPAVDDPSTLCFKGSITWWSVSGPVPQAAVFALMPDTMTRETQP